MRRLHLIIMIIGVMVMAFLLVDVRYKSQDMEEDIASIDRQIDDEHQNIRVLQAEWSYLTRPEKIQELVTRFGGMRPTVRAQLASWNQIPMAPQPATIATSQPSGSEGSAAVQEKAAADKLSAIAPAAGHENKRTSKKQTTPSVWDAIDKKGGR